MAGRITYVVTTEQAPLQSPFTVPDIFALENVFADSVPVGATQDIYLYWGYANLDPDYDDQRNVSRSAAGVVEVTNFGSTEEFRFSIPNILNDRLAQVNEFAIMSSLNEELMNGTDVRWYPDYDNYPAEYFSCIAKKRLRPKRDGTTMRFKFEFELFVLPAVQIPSTVPSFVVN